MPWKRVATYTFLFTVAIALCLEPWRNSVGQDDAAYAVFSDLIFRGLWHPPEILTAGAWPQAFFGAFARRLLPFVPALAVYMSMTFLFFVVNFAAMIRFAASKSLAALVLLLFLFPVTLQYGTAYLTETFTLTFLIFYVLVVRDYFTAPCWSRGVMIVVLTLLLATERQVALIFPLGVLVLSLLDPRWRRHAWVVAAGIFVGLLAYVLLPHTLVQSQLAPLMGARWLAREHLWLEAVDKFVQLTLALGLFGFPLLFFVRFSRRTLFVAGALQLVLLAFIQLAPSGNITVGVLFTGYLPKLIGSFLLSMGVWGLFAVWSLRPRMPRLQEFVVVGLSGCFIAFTTYIDAGDVKYMLPAGLTIVFCILVFAGASLRLNSRVFMIIYACLLVPISIVANRYYLDTVDERFAVAAELEKSGAQPALISAGYGRDTYELNEDCVERAQKKIAEMPEASRPAAIRDHLFNASPRQHEDDASFQFVVKPAMIFGKTVKIVADSGASTPKLVEYRVFGLPNALGVYENASPRVAWCFR